MEVNEIDKYYSDIILPKISNTSNFLFALYFIEAVINGLIKRREFFIKKNNNLLREIGADLIPNEEAKINAITPEGKNISIDEHTLTNNIIELDNDEKTVSIDNDSAENKSGVKKSDSTQNKKELENQPKKKNLINENKQTAQSSTFINQSNKQRRNAAPKDLAIKEWKEKCYICFDYGALICCENCSNVSHLFCACLQSEPNEWYCEKCVNKQNKKGKKK